MEDCRFSCLSDTSRTIIRLSTLALVSTIFLLNMVKFLCIACCLSHNQLDCTFFRFVRFILFFFFYIFSFFADLFCAQFNLIFFAVPYQVSNQMKSRFIVTNFFYVSRLRFDFDFSTLNFLNLIRNGLLSFFDYFVSYLNQIYFKSRAI